MLQGQSWKVFQVVNDIFHLYASWFQKLFSNCNTKAPISQNRKEELNWETQFLIFFPSGRWEQVNSCCWTKLMCKKLKKKTHQCVTWGARTDGLILKRDVSFLGEIWVMDTEIIHQPRRGRKGKGKPRTHHHTRNQI